MQVGFENFGRIARSGDLLHQMLRRKLLQPCQGTIKIGLPIHQPLHIPLMYKLCLDSADLMSRGIKTLRSDLQFKRPITNFNSAHVTLECKSNDMKELEESSLSDFGRSRYGPSNQGPFISPSQSKVT